MFLFRFPFIWPGVRATFSGTRSILLLVLATGIITADEPPPPRLAVYFPDYRYKANLEPRFYGTTHLILFSAKPNLDGSVDFSRITPDMIAMGREARKNSNLKVTFCVGGWGRGKLFATAVSTPEARTTFVNDLVQFCARHKFDGVDIDWEYPKGDAEHANFTLFLKSLSAKLHRDKRILSVALAPSRPLSREAYQAIDQVNLMSYQPWNPEPYESWLEKSVQRILDSGLEPSKVNIGLGFFTKELGGDRRAISWSKLAGSNKPLPPSEHGFSPVGRTASDLRFQLIKKYQLGGVMIWDYGHDTKDPDQSLLKYTSEKAAPKTCRGRTQ